MPIDWFECPTCGALRESMRRDPKCNHNQEEEGEPLPVTKMVKLLTAPQIKMLEPRSKDRGVSVMKGLNATLKERARLHAHQHDHDDFVQENRDPLMAKAQGWLGADGKKKKRIDLK